MIKPAKTNTLRSWLNVWLQNRRRGRLGTLAAAPIFSSSTNELGTTEAGWYDVTLYFSFVHGMFPVATLELWISFDSETYLFVARFPSTLESFTHERATQSAPVMLYKLRYVDGAIVGPFSEPFEVDLG